MLQHISSLRLFLGNPLKLFSTFSSTGSRYRTLSPPRWMLATSPSRVDRSFRKLSESLAKIMFNHMLFWQSCKLEVISRSFQTWFKRVQTRWEGQIRFTYMTLRSYVALECQAFSPSMRAELIMKHVVVGFFFRVSEIFVHGPICCSGLSADYSTDRMPQQ